MPVTIRRSLFLAVALAVCGCETQFGDSRNGVQAIQFQDIPVPAQFRLQERFHASDSLQIGQYRYGNFRYRGSVPIAEASAYFRERMPRHNWELAEQSRNEDGSREELVFQRGTYRARCELSRGETATLLAIEVRTSIPNDPNRQK